MRTTSLELNPAPLCQAAYGHITQEKPTLSAGCPYYYPKRMGSPAWLDFMSGLRIDDRDCEMPATILEVLIFLMDDSMMTLAYQWEKAMADAQRLSSRSCNCPNRAMAQCSSGISSRSMLINKKLMEARSISFSIKGPQFVCMKRSKGAPSFINILQR